MLLRQKENAILRCCSVAQSCLSLPLPWTAARQASRSFTISWHFLKLMSIESVIHPTISSSVVPFSSCLQIFPKSGPFPMSRLFASGSKVLELQLQHQSFNECSGLISFRIDYFFPCSLHKIVSSSLSSLLETLRPFEIC